MENINEMLDESYADTSFSSVTSELSAEELEEDVDLWLSPFKFMELVEDDSHRGGKPLRRTLSGPPWVSPRRGSHRVPISAPGSWSCVK